MATSGPGGRGTVGCPAAYLRQEGGCLPQPHCATSMVDQRALCLGHLAEQSRSERVTSPRLGVRRATVRGAVLAKLSRARCKADLLSVGD